MMSIYPLRGKMQINKIAITADKCKKPCNSPSFGSYNSEADNLQKKRYKHMQELSDDVLSARSIIKAHQQAQASNKMKLYKAIPSIATGLIATSVGLAQPGKLSAKAATGLGFLAILSGVSAVGDVLFSKDETKRKKAFATLGGLGAVGAGAMMVSGKGNKINNLKNVSKFVTKEVTQLSKEVNKTKLAKLSDKFVEPFMQKHPKFAFASPIVTSVASSLSGSLASFGLMKGISKDIKENACKNFENAKMIQQIARSDFDKIDAIEV